ncbi:DUF2147 domain-containing protein [Sphingomonas sediminicola]|jgi:uncharacterized protein (DUF2147 family)|uniref:DUF2147 domain-containing protein n=1 Tax=Sphingomonas sediminicola TaxID=386874 RepID=A0ABX6T885_9SPHN|nr:DUF2147 domain-containing protein [Sphingomonas sediminicola]QNP45614.1 DUF2147 domain-containing protein [Sphingomonas sediminicola]
MKRILLSIAAVAVTLGASGPANAQALEGKWANAKRSVIVHVARCGDAYCGTVSWASAKNRQKGAEPGTRVLSELRPTGGGIYKGKAFEPKRNIHGSATVRQVGPDTMVVKGCAVIGLFCSEQRWTRVS